MNSRERVVAAINHQEPDRVPIVIGGSAQKLTEPVLRGLLRHFEIPESTLEPVWAQFRFEYISEPLWERLGVDVRHVYWKPEKGFNILIQLRGESYVDEWGLDYDFSRGQGVSVCVFRRSPLRSASLEDLDKYPWPVPEAYDRTAGMRERAAALYKGTPYAVVAYRNGGIFDYACYLRGTDRFLVDLIKNKKFAWALLEKITDVLKRYYSQLMNAVGDYVHIVEIADDLGTQDGPMISPKIYREIIKPHHMELIRTIKKKHPKVKVMIHCDGGVKPLLPDFVEAGIDILNPVQTTARGMDLVALKREFGEDLVFQGAIDTQHVLREGTPVQVADEVKRVIDILAPGGGFLLGPSHNVLPDVPIENLIAMFETAQCYGRA